MTLDEASYDVVRQLLEIGAREGRVPNITRVCSIEPIPDNEASIWLELDDENANEGMGILWVHVDLSAVIGVSVETIFQTLTAGMMRELSDLGETTIMRALSRGAIHLV